MYEIHVKAQSIEVFTYRCSTKATDHACIAVRGKVNIIMHHMQSRPCSLHPAHGRDPLCVLTSPSPSCTRPINWVRVQWSWSSRQTWLWFYWPEGGTGYRWKDSTDAMMVKTLLLCSAKAHHPVGGLEAEPTHCTTMTALASTGKTFTASLDPRPH